MAYRFKHFLREQEDTEEMNGIRISRPHYTTHNLSDDHLEHLTSHPDVQNGMGPVTLTIPENLPKLKSGLVGPSVGDPPVTRKTRVQFPAVEFLLYRDLLELLKVKKRNSIYQH